MNNAIAVFNTMYKLLLECMCLAGTLIAVIARELLVALPLVLSFSPTLLDTVVFLFPTSTTNKQNKMTYVNWRAQLRDCTEPYHCLQGLRSNLLKTPQYPRGCSESPPLCML